MVLTLSRLLPQNHPNKRSWTDGQRFVQFHEHVQRSLKLQDHRGLREPLCERERKELQHECANVLLHRDQCARDDSGGAGLLLLLSDRAYASDGGQPLPVRECFLLLIGLYVIVLSW